MGEVWEAEQVSLGRRVALKLLFPTAEAEAVRRERFLREMRLSSTLSHPNVVRIFDSGAEDGRPWYAMELLAGRDLAHLSAECGPLPPVTRRHLTARGPTGLAVVVIEP